MDIGVLDEDVELPFLDGNVVCKVAFILLNVEQVGRVKGRKGKVLAHNISTK